MKIPFPNSTQTTNWRVLDQARTQACHVGLGLLVGMFLPVAAANADEFLSDGNFDNLDIGTARDVMSFQPFSAGPGDQHVGSWALIGTSASCACDGQENVSIVPTASFDPGLTGNSVRIEAPSVGSRFVQVFEPIAEAPNEIVRASFDAFIPDAGTGRIGALSLIVGGRDSGRGPRLDWDSNGRLNSGGQVQLAESPGNTWQHLQMDIDLVNDTFDLFASSGGESLELIEPNVGFQQSLDFLDYVNVWLLGDGRGSRGVAYFDNFSVEVLTKTPGDYNFDGEINTADFRTLAENFGVGSARSPAAWSQGDFDGNGSVGFSDLMLLSEVISDTETKELVSLFEAPQVTSVTVGQTYEQDFNFLSADGAAGSQLPTAWSVTDQHGAVRRIDSNGDFPVSSRIARDAATPVALNAGAPEGDKMGDRSLALYKPHGGQEDPAAIQLLADTEGAAGAVQIEFSVEAWDRARTTDENRAGGEARFDVSIEIDSGEGSEISDIIGGEVTKLVDLGTVTTGADLPGLTGGILDGNDEEHRVTFKSEVLHADIPAGSRLRFRWETTGEADASDAWVFGIDDVSITLVAAGDTDRNGEVNFVDFSALAGNFGDAGGWKQGDFDGSGQVDFPDFLALAENFGNVAKASAAAVPEPTAACMAVFGLLGLIGFRKRR